MFTEFTPALEFAVSNKNGTPRGAKGTQANHEAGVFEEVASEETGQDYRMVARTLYVRGLVEVNAPVEAVVHTLEGIPSDEIGDIIAGRKTFVREHGDTELYAQYVHDLVPNVGQSLRVRKEVKAQLVQRIEKHKADGKKIVVLDGRALDKVVREQTDFPILLDTFVQCTPWEATLRECAKEGIDPHHPSNKEQVQAILKGNQDRLAKDQRRSEDAVVKKPDALDFHELRRQGHSPREIGALAARSGLQVFHETTYYRGRFEDPRAAMLADSDEVLLGATEVAGIKLTRVA